MTLTVQARRPLPIVAYRSLVWNFAQRDLKSRFKGSLVGWGWSLLVPLASLLIYTLVSRVIFRAVPPAFGNGHQGNFAAWLFVGLTVWGFFGNGVNTAIGSLLASGGLLSKIYFPSYAPVLGALVAVGIQSGIELGLALAAVLLFGNVGTSWLLVPVLVVFYAAFTAGVAVVFAIANIYLRDLQHIVAVILQLLFYATPIIYPPTLISAHWHGISLHALIMANPLSQFVDLFRDLVYGLSYGTPGAWLSVAAWSVAAVVVAAVVFTRRGQELGEQV
jgi:ABC-type polysaccharide/polyol phosphate export permease